MFRQRQKFLSDLVGVGRYSYPSVNEQNGFVERVKRSHAEVLASSELFDPTACVKAGKNLDQVRSNVFGITEDSFKNYETANETENSQST